MSFASLLRISRRGSAANPLLRSLVKNITRQKADCLAAEELRIPVPWGHMAAKAWGPENGIPVLGIHGQLDNAGSFDTLAPLLIPHSIRLICVDLADHGLSSRTPPGMINCDYMAHAYQIQLVVDFFGWKKVNLLAHSLGAFMAMFWARGNPNRVKSVVNIDGLRLTPFPNELEFPDRMAKYMKNIFQVIEKSLDQSGKGMTYEEARDKMIKKYKEVGNDMMGTAEADILLKRGLIKVGHHEGQDLYKYSWDPRATLRLYLIADAQFKSLVSTLKCPLLYIRPEQGFIWPEETEEHISEYFDKFYRQNKQFRLIRLPGYHHIHLQHPERVAPHYLQFLSDVYSSSSV